MAEVNLSDLLYAIKEQNQGNEITEFLGHCLVNLKHSQSQNFQDIWALYENSAWGVTDGFRKHGYFVEFGATDGKTGSNTYLLEKTYGWGGIVAEPNPVWHEELDENRNCFIDKRCVYSVTGDSIPFVASKAADLSTIKGFEDSDYHSQTRKDSKIIPVETISLVDLLKSHNSGCFINYLSIDTEGSEYAILSTFFSDPESQKFPIHCMTIEHNYHPTMRDKLYQLMTNNGYVRKFEGFSRWDDFYLKVR